VLRPPSRVRRTTPAPWPLALLLIIACLRAASVGARSVSLDSGPRTRPITIDGKLDDWQDALVYVKQGNLAIGLMNDGADLYLCLQSRDPAVNLQILDQGMTAWLSAPGADAKQFGIEYPLARDRVETYSRMTTANASAADAPPGAPGGGQGGATAGTPGVVEGHGALTRLAIRGAAPDDRRIMSVADATGISASAAQVDDAFVYEMRIPLAKSPEHPYAIGAAPGDRIELLLETPEPAPYLNEHGGGASRGGGPGGGAAGGGGMGGHGGGGFGGGGYGGGGHGGGHHGGGGGSGGGGRGAGAPTQTVPAGSAALPAPLNLTIKARLAAVRP
jgi:hypothetical protein